MLFIFNWKKKRFDQAKWQGKRKRFYKCHSSTFPISQTKRKRNARYERMREREKQKGRKGKKHKKVLLKRKIQFIFLNFVHLHSIFLPVYFSLLFDEENRRKRSIFHCKHEIFLRLRSFLGCTSANTWKSEAILRWKIGVKRTQNVFNFFASHNCISSLSCLSQCISSFHHLF